MVVLVKMADPKEADELRKQIAFLTDLINKAKQKKPKLSSVSSCPSVPSRKVYGHDLLQTGHSQRVGITHKELQSLPVCTQTGFTSNHPRPGPSANTVEKPYRCSKYSFKRIPQTKDNQSFSMMAASVTESAVLKNASDQLMSQAPHKPAVAGNKAFKSAPVSHKSSMLVSSIVKTSNKEPPSDFSNRKKQFSNKSGCGLSGIQTSKLSTKSSSESTISSVKGKISECSNMTVNIGNGADIQISKQSTKSSSKSMVLSNTVKEKTEHSNMTETVYTGAAAFNNLKSKSFAESNSECTTTTSNNLGVKKKITTSSGTGLTSDVTALNIVAACKSVNTSSVQSSQLLSQVGENVGEKYKHHISTISKGINGRPQSAQTKAQVLRERLLVVKSVRSAELVEEQHLSASQDEISLLPNIPKDSHVQQQEPLNRSSGSETTIKSNFAGSVSLPESDCAGAVGAASTAKDQEMETDHNERLQKTKTSSLSSQRSVNGLGTTSSSESMRPHKCSLTQLLRRNAKSVPNVDLVSKSEQSDCRLDADFIPLHLSSATDSNKVTTVSNSEDSCTPESRSSSSYIPLIASKGSSTLCGVSSDSVIPLSSNSSIPLSLDSVISLSSDSSVSLLTAVTSSTLPYRSSVDSVSVTTPTDSLNLLKNPCVSVKPLKSLNSAQASNVSGNNGKKDEAVISIELTSNKHGSEKPKTLGCEIQRCVSEESTVTIESEITKPSSNPVSPMRKKALPNPASPLRLQKVATLMSDLQKTQSTIEHLKESIGGILQNKLKGVQKKSQVSALRRDATDSGVSKQMRRRNSIDKRKLLKQKQLLKQKKLLGKVWVREKSETTPVKNTASASISTKTVVKSKYRIVKGLKSASKHNLSGSRSFHSSSQSRRFQYSSLQSTSQHAARVIVGKYKLSRREDIVPSGSVSQRGLVGNGGSYSSAVSSFSSQCRTNNLQWTLHKVWSNRRRKGDIYHAGLPWNRGHWWRHSYTQTLKQKAELARYLHFIKSLSRPLISTRKPNLKMSRTKNARSGRLVFIHGVLYKASGNKLVKTGSKSVDHRKLTRNITATSAVVKKMAGGGKRTIIVGGVTFYLDATGHTLRRVRSAQELFASTSAHSQHSHLKLRRLDIGGTTYVQTRPGTLIKSSYIRARTSRIKSRNVLSSMARFRKDATQPDKNLCKFYHRFGRCRRGNDCPFIHDPDRVAVCTRFLRGTCKIDGCPFSHQASREKVPVCSYFLRGVCNRDYCPYLHVKVNRHAEVCPAFIAGFCPLGERCNKQHTRECPEFSRTGACPRGTRCKMEHRRRKTRAANKHAVRGSGPTPTLPQSATESERPTGDGVDNHDVSDTQRDLPAFISLERYCVDDLLSPAVSKATISNKGPSLRIKPQL